MSLASELWEFTRRRTALPCTASRRMKLIKSGQGKGLSKRISTSPALSRWLRKKQSTPFILATVSCLRILHLPARARKQELSSSDRHPDCLNFSETRQLQGDWRIQLACRCSREQRNR